MNSLRALILVLAVGCSAFGQAVWNGRLYRSAMCNNRNCTMCASIRSQLYRQQAIAKPKPETSRVITGYRTVKRCNGRQCWYERVPIYKTVAVEAKPSPPPIVDIDPGQAGLSAKDINNTLAALDLTLADVFCDLGCGDGRVLIAAVKQYGCRAIGIEIDPKMADRARRQVRFAEEAREIPRGYITIITGDAVDWDPKRYGITAAVAYLFPDTLAELRPVLAKIPKVATPFHRIPGAIENKKSKGGVYVYKHLSETQLTGVKR